MSRARLKLDELLTITNGHSYRPSSKYLLFPRDVFKVSCVGKLHSGKSTLLNQLIGKDLLPSGMDSDGVTRLPIFLYRGQGTTINFILPDGSVESFSGNKCWKEAFKYLDQVNNEKFPYLRIELPSTTQIPENMLLIDVPGLDGSPWAELDTEEEYYALRCNHWVLSFSDVVLFCGGYRDICTRENEIIQPYDIHRILVISHCDTYYNEEDDKTAFYDFNHNYSIVSETFDELRKLVIKNVYSSNVVGKLNELEKEMTKEKYNYQKGFLEKLIISFGERHKSAFQETYFIAPEFCRVKDNIPSVIGYENLKKLRDRLFSMASKTKGKEECYDMVFLEKKINALIHKLKSSSGINEIMSALLSELAYAKKTGFFSEKNKELLKMAKNGHLLDEERWTVFLS